MTYQEQVVKITQRALDDLLRAVGAIPEEKRDWRPAPTSRSALNQLVECAVAPAMFLPLIREGKMPDFDGHSKREAVRIRRSYDTFEKARDAARQSTAELCAVVSTFPDDRLDEEVSAPFGGGSVLTMADALYLHAWNMTYHLGQVNYIQTLLGDQDMH